MESCAIDEDVDAMGDPAQAAGLCRRDKSTTRFGIGGFGGPGRQQHVGQSHTVNDGGTALYVIIFLPLVASRWLEKTGCEVKGRTMENLIHNSLQFSGLCGRLPRTSKLWITGVAVKQIVIPLGAGGAGPRSPGAKQAVRWAVIAYIDFFLRAFRRSSCWILVYFCGRFWHRTRQAHAVVIVSLSLNNASYHAGSVSSRPGGVAKGQMEAPGRRVGAPAGAALRRHSQAVGNVLPDLSAISIEVEATTIASVVALPRRRRFATPRRWSTTRSVVPRRHHTWFCCR